VQDDIIDTASLETMEIGDERDEPGKSVTAVGDRRRTYTDAWAGLFGGEDVLFPKFYCFSDGEVCLFCYVGFVEAPFVWSVLFAIE